MAAENKQTEYPVLKLNTGATMPMLGFGTFLSAPGEVADAVRAALKTGYKHIDCAAVYGNEKEIGAVFAEFFNNKESGIAREDIFITSKLWVADARPDTVLDCLKKTLADLQLDYLDLYLIHQPIIVEDDPTYDGKDRLVGKFRPVRQGWGLQDLWRKMEEAHGSGLTKAIGVSNYNVQTLNDCLMYAKTLPAVNQVERHPYLAQPELMKFCTENGIVTTNYAPLGAPGLFGEQKVPQLNHPVIGAVAAAHKKTPAQVLIRWGIDTGSIVIPKSVKEHRIQENFNVLDFALSPEELKAIATLDVGGRSFMQDWMGVPTFY